MKLPFKFKSNPQAFKASLIIVLAAFILKFIFLQLFSTNTDLENESLLISILYFLIFLIIVRITIELYIRNQINVGVSKLLRQRKSEINILNEEVNVIAQTYHAFESICIKKFKGVTGHIPLLCDNSDPGY